MAERVYRYNLTPFLYRFEDKKNHGWDASLNDFVRFIVEEVEDIITSRCGFGMDDYDTIYSTINYGIPDLATLNRSDEPTEFSLQVKRALETLEPRLSQIDINIDTDDKNLIQIKIRARICSPIGEVRNILINVFNDGKAVTELQT
jgi:predicted component of type VI protein secretion system